MKSLLLQFYLITFVVGGSLVDLQLKQLKKIFPPVPKATLVKMLRRLNSSPYQPQICESFNTTNYWKEEKQKMNIRAAANCVAWVKNHAQVKKKVDAIFAGLPRNKKTSAYKAAELKTLWWNKYRETNVDIILSWDKFFDEYENLLFTKKDNSSVFGYIDIRRVIQDERFRELKTSGRRMWYAWEDTLKNL